mgnify:CR=1 FL=1
MKSLNDLPTKEEIRYYYASLHHMFAVEFSADINDYTEDGGEFYHTILDLLDKAEKYDLQRLSRQVGGIRAAQKMTEKQRKRRARKAARSK